VVWFLISALVVSIVLSEVLRPKPNIEDARPSGIGDFSIPTATAGRVIPVIFGLNEIRGPNVVWNDDLETEAILEEVRTGLWSKESFIRGFRYRLGLQFAICRGGDGVTLHRVRVGETEVFSGTVSTETRFDVDAPELLGGDQYGSGGVQATCDFYPGTTTQGVNAYLDTADRQRITAAATPTAPRYTGTCHIVAREMTSAAPSASDRGAYLGNSTSIQPWSFEVSRYPAIFSGQSAGQHKIGDECNPANVIYELITNTEWGFGRAASTVDVGVGSSFAKASATLIAEGNGFSMVVDRQMSAKALIAEVARQIDGHVYLDHLTGKWKIYLVRGAADANWGWDINTVPQLDEDSIREIRSLTRNDWSETTVQVQVRYHERADNYKEALAPSQNTSAAIILGGGVITTPRGSPSIIDYPGIRTGALAANIASRDARALSRPLVRATLRINRDAWDSQVGTVMAWTDERQGFDQLPVRVRRINYGELADNTIEVDVVEDVFAYSPAVFGSPPASNWEQSTITLVAYPSDEQLAVEAPRALVVRTPGYSGDPEVSKVLAAVRRQGAEVAVQINQRNSSGAPSGSFAVAGSIASFARIGELSSALAAGTAIPTTSISIEATPDGQAALESVFDDSTTLADLGADLVQLVVVDDEFMLVRSASTSGADVLLENVYRGACGTGQAPHAAGASVWLLFVGANVTDTIFPNTNNVDVQLRPRSYSEVFAGAVTTISLTMAKRALRPYPPSAILYNGSATPFGTPALEGDGSGLNGVGFDVDVRRRRFDTTDEVAEMLADQAVDASTEHRVRVYVDPTGANTLAHDSGWFSGVAIPAIVTQVELVAVAAAGTPIRVRADSRHDYRGEVDLESWGGTYDDSTPTSARSAQFYLGARAPNVATAAYAALANGTYVVNIGGAFSSSVVEYRLNAGAWTTVIGTGLTTGNIAGVVATDVIELRHTAADAPSPNFIELLNPSATAVAYGALLDS